ncbi:MAG: ABC transporter substrate-binding protein [bacterium]
MGNSKRLWWGVGIIALIVIIILASNNNTSQTGPIKVGLIAPFSGDAAVYGDTEKRATDMVVNKINAEGGIKGKQIQMIYEDGKCSGKDALTAATKLINIDKVKVILGGTCSSETLSIAPLAEQNKVILFSAFSSSPDITNSGDYIFRNSPSDNDVAKLDGDTIIQGGFKKVAMISENNAYSQGVRKVMTDLFSTKNVSVVLDQSFEGVTTDFRDYVLKVKESGADVVYVNPGSSGKPGALLVKQLRQAGVTTPIHGNFSIGTADAMAVAGNLLNGVVLSDSARPTSALTDLINVYQQKFGAKPVNNFEFGASYDRAGVIFSAIKSVGYSPDKIKDYLYGVKDYSGVTGVFGFDKNGDVLGGPFFSEYVIQDQKEIPLTQ